MHKSSLLEILRTFTPKELVKFEDFVNSPYFNKNKNVINLFIEVKKYVPEFKEIGLEKEKVWKKLFTDKEYNYGIMKNLIFDLNKLAEQFIIILKFNKDEYKQNEYFISAMLDKKLHKMYINKHNAMDKGPDIDYLNANNIELDNYLYFKINIYEMKLLYHQQFDRNFKIESLQLKHDFYKLSVFLIQLIAAYGNAIVSKLSENIDPSNNPIFKFLELNYHNLEIVMESLKNGTSDMYQYIKIYQQFILSLKENTDETYFEFKNTLFENLNILPRREIQSFHYCVYLALTLNI
ncbi:MAG: hypothetical protein ABIY50_06725 [Ignavibacteria bacterium]